MEVVKLGVMEPVQDAVAAVIAVPLDVVDLAARAARQKEKDRPVQHAIPVPDARDVVMPALVALGVAAVVLDVADVMGVGVLVQEHANRVQDIAAQLALDAKIAAVDAMAALGAAAAALGVQAHALEVAVQGVLVNALTVPEIVQVIAGNLVCRSVLQHVLLRVQGNPLVQ